MPPLLVVQSFGVKVKGFHNRCWRRIPENLETFSNRILEVCFNTTFSILEPAGSICQSSFSLRAAPSSRKWVETATDHQVNCILACCAATSSSHAHKDHCEFSTFLITLGWALKRLSAQGKLWQNRDSHS